MGEKAEMLKCLRSITKTGVGESGTMEETRVTVREVWSSRLRAHCAQPNEKTR